MSNIELALSSAIKLVYSKLWDFAKNPDFTAKMKLAFGQDVNVDDLQAAWTRGDINFPNIEVVPTESLNGANGAFAVATGTIYKGNAENP
ncbi:MAG: hypothetical protein HEQ24_19010 [Dolichospermum sp. BR01]|nr:hypothetical protein [Dolichospermum sp. BR01]